METVAKLKHLRISPRKIRLVANLIKGLDVSEAKFQLENLSKASSGPVLKLINSAIANARHNFNLPEEGLYVKSIFVDGGPSLKRWMPRAMGRATPIMKRTSHITLILDQREGAVAKKGRKVKKEPALEPAPIEKSEPIAEKPKEKPKAILPRRPYGDSSQSKKRFFSRQTFRNVKKLFRRKSI